MASLAFYQALNITTHNAHVLYKKDYYAASEQYRARTRKLDRADFMSSIAMSFLEFYRFFEKRSEQETDGLSRPYKVMPPGWLRARRAATSWHVAHAFHGRRATTTS